MLQLHLLVCMLQHSEQTRQIADLKISSLKVLESHLLNVTTYQKFLILSAKIGECHIVMCPTKEQPQCKLSSPDITSIIMTILNKLGLKRKLNIVIQKTNPKKNS